MSRTKNNSEKFDACGDSSSLASNFSPLVFESLIINGAIIRGYHREKQVSGKAKSSNGGRKRKSVRPRYLLV